MLDDPACYRALAARDARFDGLFFVGVRTTGIYCRPVCTAKTPRPASCRFFRSAALAEQAGFRPCLRCRPELAPGHAPVDQMRHVALAAARRIEAGALNEGSLEDLAAGLRLSSRQLRRAVRQELGVSPIELAQTTRLLLAKRLIAETRLPLTQVALAAGFESIRRFNALFQSRYRLTPGSLRRAPSPDQRRGDAEGPRSETAPDVLRLTLTYRPPLDGPAMWRFLAARAIPGVECVADGAYRRTVAVGEHRGWLSVSLVPDRSWLAVEMAASLAPALPFLLARLRHLFDLDARPDVIASHLGADPRLAALVARRPGLRVPGALDPFELAWRAVLGQQVTVRGASTLAGRLAERFGEPIETPWACLNRVTPTAEALARARTTSLTGAGLTHARAVAVQQLARAIRSGQIDLLPGPDPTEIVTRLVHLPGVGPWTAEYIALRGLCWPDAFPSRDLGLLKAASVRTPAALERLAVAWRPWRGYAAVHLWESLTDA